MIFNINNMKKLREIYESGENVNESQIPEKWKKSFNLFMLGQTCLIANDEFIFYSSDFRRWYNINKLEIERDEKINSIIK
jgi:hypothetical protein